VVFTVAVRGRRTERHQKEHTMRLARLLQAGLGAALLSFALSSGAYAAAKAQHNPTEDTYTQQEIVQKAADFFGATTEAVAKAVEHVFREKGRPNAYITGSEGAGAFVVGLRYGEGELYMKKTGAKTEKVYWQGPSVGFDFGGNASKTFVLVYNLPNTGAIYQRFPGVDGSIYVVAGIGVNYQQAGNIILAPMRTGVGLRAGANVGYLAYTKERNISPF
jgi:hypothetical protein